MMKSGRTHMQDAVPIRLGQEFAAYAAGHAQGAENIRRNSENLRELGLGGSAVGTGINTHPDYRGHGDREPQSRISGQKLSRPTTCAGPCNRMPPMAEVSAALRNLALEVIRISNDVRLLVVRSEHRLRRDLFAGAAARFIDHAGQDQSGNA